MNATSNTTPVSKPKNIASRIRCMTGSDYTAIAARYARTPNIGMTHTLEGSGRKISLTAEEVAYLARLAN